MIKRAGLPTTIPQSINPAEIEQQLNNDKKRHDERVRWVLPRRMGEVFQTEDVPSDIVLKVLHSMTGSSEG
jgi:3-dehydroquinate synthase